MRFPPIIWAVLLGLVLTWGSSFLLMHLGLAVFTWYQVASIRVSVSMLLLLPVLVRNWSEVPHDRWGYAFATGLTGNLMPALLFTIAQTHVTSSAAGILNSLTPLWVMTIGAVAFGVRLTRWRVGGMAIGLVGAGLLVAFRAHNGTSAGEVDNRFGVFIIIATMMYGLSANLIKAHFSDVRATTANMMALSTVGVFTLPFLLFGTDFITRLTTTEGGYAAFTAVFFLALFSTVLGGIAYYWLIARTSAVFASSTTYMMPIVSVVLGLGWGETVLPVQIAGMCLILLGVYFVSRK